MDRRSPWRRTSLIALALLAVAAFGAAEHQAQSPSPNAVGETISEVGHERPDRSLHLEAAIVEAPHSCVVCWLGSSGLAATPASLGSVRLASAPRAPVEAAEPRAARVFTAPSRGPPLA